VNTAAKNPLILKWKFEIAKFDEYTTERKQVKLAAWDGTGIGIPEHHTRLLDSFSLECYTKTVISIL